MKARASNQGFVLAAVLVLIMLVSMVAVSLLFRLKAEESATAAGAGAEQAWAAAMSGVREAMRIATNAVPGSVSWQDNPRAFRDRFVFDDGSERWYFTVCSPAAGDSSGELRYGLADEASKRNLRTTSPAELGKLPLFTPALVTALRDFQNPDLSSGAETLEPTGLDGLPRAETVHQGSLDTLDQLLLVPGFTPALLYGEDVNLNWRLDPNENDGDQRFPPDNSDGKLHLGLREFLTTFSSEPNIDNQGLPRANLHTGSDLPSGVELPPAFTNYLAALRTGRTRLVHPAELLEATLKVKDATGKETEIPSGIGQAELPIILDRFTATSAEHSDGLVNVNTASAAVLATVPGVDESLAESLISTRRSIGAERRATLAWIYQEGLVDAPRFKKLAPHLTARAFQYSFHVVGFGVPSGRYRTLDVIIDLAEGAPRIAYLRDLTRLGLPFRLDTALAKEASGG